VEISQTEIPTFPQPQLKLDINIQDTKVRRRHEEDAHAGTPAGGRRRVGERVGPGENAVYESEALSPDPNLSSTHRAPRGASIEVFLEHPTLLRGVFVNFVPSC
jgi:hypothetical protein